MARVFNLGVRRITFTVDGIVQAFVIRVTAVEALALKLYFLVTRFVRFQYLITAYNIKKNIAIIKR